ncbi:MAG: DNA repair protein RadA [Coriobacteriia bacterium]|nr:DNA repair protein RadA [Coriobacteriia bacterium]
MSAKPRTTWRCQDCGASALQWYGRCPDCGLFGTLVEAAIEAVPVVTAGPPLRRIAVPQAGTDSCERMSVGIAELDRALGGGLVIGSLVLLGGEPGIGKSTLLLQASDAIGRFANVWYVCGEESPSQIGMRARRLGLPCEGVTLVPEIDISLVERDLLASPPDVLIVDSIQTVYDPELSGAPGSVGQVRAVTSRLMRIAKDHGVTTVIAGHVTKDGAIAGPRVLEHMVDTVLYFEGDRDHAYRLVRAVKNRFGSASEIGVFEMTDGGLRGVGNPSALFLGDREEPQPGSVVMVTMEGSRPMLVEVQALVTPTYLQMPRRVATGIENARLLQLIAVLERRAGVSFAGYDVYVTVAGGVRVIEPAVDLPLALALVSARQDRVLPGNLAAFGEIGLTGGVRSVSHAEARLSEAMQQGLSTVVASLPPGVRVPESLAVHPMGSVSALAALMS